MPKNFPCRKPPYSICVSGQRNEDYSGEHVRSEPESSCNESNFNSSNFRRENDCYEGDRMADYIHRSRLEALHSNRRPERNIDEMIRTHKPTRRPPCEPKPFSPNRPVDSTHDQYDRCNRYDQHYQYDRYNQYDRHNQTVQCNRCNHYDQHNQPGQSNQYDQHNQYDSHNQYDRLIQPDQSNQYKPQNQYDQSNQYDLRNQYDPLNQPDPRNQLDEHKQPNQPGDQPVKDNRNQSTPDVSNESKFENKRPTFLTKPDLRETDNTHMDHYSPPEKGTTNKLEDDYSKYVQCKRILPSQFKLDDSKPYCICHDCSETKLRRKTDISDNNYPAEHPYQQEETLAIKGEESKSEPVDSVAESVAESKAECIVESEMSTETPCHNYFHDCDCLEEEVCEVHLKTKCKKKKPKREKGFRWLTPLIASTHCPSKWLSAMIKDFIIYLIFLISLATVVFFSSDPGLYYYCRTVFSILRKEPMALENAPPGFIRTGFFGIDTVQSSWQFLMEEFELTSFIGRVGSNPDESSSILEMRETYLIGAGRLRQVRVKKDKCPVLPGLKTFFPSCYGYYSSFSKDKEKFGDEDSTEWKYQDDPNDRMYFGRVSNYDGGGYFYIFSFESGTIREDLKLLLQRNWLDRATRAVFIDFTLYTPTVNCFHIIKLVLEFPPSGGSIPSAHCYSLKLLRYSSGYDFIILGVELLVVLCIIYYTVQLIREIIFYGLSYVLLFWGVYDFFLILIAHLNIVLWVTSTIKSFIEVPVIMDTAINSDEYFPNFDRIAQLALVSQTVSAILLFMVLIKIFNYLTMCKTFYYFSSVLGDCAMQLIVHMVLVIILMLIFSIFGYLLFGAQVEEFSSVGWSFFTLFIMIFGTFGYQKFLAVNFVMSPIFIYMFILSVLFVFVNFFIVIFVLACSRPLCNVRCPKLFLGEALSKFVAIARLSKPYKKKKFKKEKCK